MIPVVYSFDDDLALPAWVSIASLLNNAENTTSYDVWVLYSKLSDKIMQRFEQFSDGRHKISFKKVVESPLKDNKAVYLGVCAELLQYKKVLFCNVETKFRTDLTKVYDLGDSVLENMDKIVDYYGVCDIKKWKKLNTEYEYLSYILKSPFADEYLYKNQLRRLIWVASPLLRAAEQLPLSKKLKDKLKKIKNYDF